MKVAGSWLMFGDPFHRKYLAKFLKLLDNLQRTFSLTFPMAYLAFLYFCGLTLVLKSRAVTNPFPDLPNFTFDSEDVVLILFRLSNVSEIFKVDLLVFPNFATTKIFHVHRLKQRTSSKWSNHDK